MSAWNPQPPNTATVPAAGLRLPDMGGDGAPGWRVVQHSTRAIAGVFLAMLTVLLAVGTFASMRVTVDGGGVIEPGVVWPVRSMESGVVAEVLVTSGDTVREGQILARLDMTTASTGLREAEAQLAAARIEAEHLKRAMPIDSSRAATALVAARAQLDGARTALRERMAEYSIKGDVDSVARASASRVHVGLDASAASYSAAQARFAGAQTEVDAVRLTLFGQEQQRTEIGRLETVLEVARRRMSRQTIRAPTSGVVLTDDVRLIVGTATIPGQTLIEIATTKHWSAELRVSEHDVHRLQIGDTADVELPALSAMAVDRLPGTVTFVGWQASTQSSALNSRVAMSPAFGGYRVLVHLDSAAIAALPPNTLRRGYAARGRIVTRSARVIHVLFDEIRQKLRSVSR